jgi:hypothetical protein
VFWFNGLAIMEGGENDKNQCNITKHAAKYHQNVFKKH